MKTFRLHKLVRDNMVSMMQEVGQEVEFRVLDRAEFLKALMAKLIEEAAEFDPAKPDALKELADLQEVIDQAVIELGATPETFKALQDARAEERGSFTKRLFVESVTMADSEPWANYYEAEPERFPVIETNDRFIV